MRETNRFVSAGRTLGLVLLTAAVAACGGGGGSTQQAVAKPAGLVYTERSVIATVGNHISLAPRSSGGVIKLYEVAPSLPLGVLINPGTGIISGRASQVSHSTLYTITGKNSAGSVQTSVRIEVKSDEIKPSGLSYPNEELMTFVAGEAINSVFPKTEGGRITRYSISPSLPDGLHFNTQTGEISGTPSKPFAVSGYTVEGHNGAGSIGTSVKIQVVSKEAKLTEPKYTNPRVIAVVGQPVHMEPPTIGGSGPIRYSIDPSLPSGLSFNSDLGIITGTPEVTWDFRPYTVTARNSAGHTFTTLYLRVDPKPEWSAFNAMNTARAKHTATLLPDNHVLVAGGVGTGGVALNSVERYEAGTKKWSQRAPMNLARSGATALLLSQGTKKGQVLVVGGFDGRSDLNSAEMYDPSANRWTPVASMAQARGNPAVTLLSDGKVLVAGGNVHGQPSETTELYDPEANTWTNALPMRTPRAGHVATVLKNGKVLVVGGKTAGGELTLTAELYDPNTKQWSRASDMAVQDGLKPSARTATLLSNGKVLVTASSGRVGRKFAELYDPDTNQWFVEEMLNVGIGPNFGYTATLLQNGQVLLAGGHRYLQENSSKGRSYSLGILFDPNTWHQRWRQVNFIPGVERGDHTATLLSDGTVLILGGKDFDKETYLPSAELFTSRNDAR